MGVDGDFDGDEQLTASDIDLLFAAIRDESADQRFDLNQDNQLDELDADYLIEGRMNTRRGDFDLSGEVGFADFLLLSANFGKQNAKWEDGDADGNNEVNFADFLLLSANFGKLAKFASSVACGLLGCWASFPDCHPELKPNCATMILF